MLVAAAVDQVGRARGAHVGVVERLEHRLDIAREVLGVHPVDGVGQRRRTPNWRVAREARPVLDVARLLAVVPVHAGDPVLVGADAGGDRRRAHRRHRGKRRDAVVDIEALAPDPRQCRRPADGDRAVEHRRLDRVDHDQHELLSLSRVTIAPARGSSAQDPQSRVLLFPAPTAGAQQPKQEHEPDRPPAARGPTAPRESADALRIGGTARGLRVQPGTNPSSSGRWRGSRRPRTPPAINPGQPVVARSSAPREQQARRCGADGATRP